MALKRYDIWDKVTDIIVPTGDIFTPAQWMEKYPVAKVLTIVCGQKPINGSFFGVLDQMVNMYANDGCEFTDDMTDIEKLEAIEAFEDARNTPDPNYVSVEERTANALEDLVVLRELEAQNQNQ